MFKKNLSLFISILLHLIVIYVVARSVVFPSIPNSPSKKSDIIQATLIFDLPTPIVEVIKQGSPEPAEPKEPIPVKETPTASQIESISEPEVQVITVPPQPQTPPPKLKEEMLNEIQKEVPDEPEKNNEVIDFIITEQTITPRPNPEMLSPSTSMARRHLSSFQQKQQNRVAEQASRYYQQHKNSPVIDDEVKNPFMSEGEKLRDSLTIRADCSSAGKKTTAVIIGFLSGQADCSKPPPISGFIKDRINKESQSPEQYQQEMQETPQSIVIKKQP